MPLTVTVNMIAECLRTDCSILGDKLKNFKFKEASRELKGLSTCSSRPLKCPYKGLNDEVIEIK